MKILVSGATGFIGRQIVSRLLAQGHSVIAASRRRPDPQHCPWADRVHWLPLHIGGPAPLSQQLAELADDPPGLLIHTAWDHLDNYRSLAHLEDLLLPHYFFVKHCVGAGISRCLVTGTCLEYGLQEGCLSEATPARPQVPYAVAKHVLHQMLEALQTCQPFQLLWARLFYLYGAGQRDSSLLAQLDEALTRGDRQFDMSPGDQQRDYLEVGEAAALLCALALNPRAEGTVNCCSGSPVAVVDLVRRHLARSGRTLQLNLGKYSYPAHEPRHFWGDTTLLRQLTEAEP
ncbi:MAG: hypothetical protein RLZZ385_1534 [Pseudomonadota bacterium]|jgi:dTDP-6-deoxy-L-talose 4-dehydrogenase (NAD+)